MPITPYVKPQVLVFQEFNVTPSAATSPLPAHISGAHAYLVRHAQAAEKPNGSLGAYDPNNDRDYPWPTLPPAAIVDPGFTKVLVDGALLEYFADLIGVDNLVTPVAGIPNQVKIAGASGFKANGTAFPRLPALFDRDVQPGDRVTVRGTAAGLSYALDTYVQAVLPEFTASLVDAATYGAGNGTTQSATSTVAQVAGVVNCNTPAASLAGYSAYADGFLNDTYTITVLSGSVAGDLRTALLRVTSASGQDDVLSTSPGEVDEFFAVGRRGLQLKFACAGHPNASLSTADLVVGQSWTIAVHDDYKSISAASGGTYAGTSDTTYIVTVTRGGLFADAAKPTVTVTTTTGVDVGNPQAIPAIGTALVVGTRGVTVTLSGAGATGLRKGDVFYIPAHAAAPGRYSILSLGHVLPAPIQSAIDLDLHLAIQADVAVARDRVGFEPLTNWDQAPALLTVRSGLLAFDPSFTSAGVPQPIPVVSGGLFVEYRAWRQDLVGDVGSIDDPGALSTAIVGALTPDNPLAWGVFNALNNANGTPVLFTAVADPASTTAWEDVISLLVGRIDVYNLVPLTHDPVVLNLFAAHCASESSAENGRWRAMFLSLQAAAQLPVASAASSTDGGVVLATLSADPNAAGASYTILAVPAGNSNFLANKVRPLDVVRLNYSTSFGVETWSEFAVAAVLTENSLRLVAGPPDPITVPSKVEAWHPLSKDEQAAQVGSQAAAYASRRVKAVWPDKVGSGGTVMDGYFLCAALAGLRSGVVPQQGLTRLQLKGFDDLSRSTKFFNDAQLSTMASSGTWVVTQDPSGAVYTRQALTTDTTDLNHQAEMLTANLDSLSYLFLARLAPFIGVTNVTPTAIARMQAELVSAIEFAKAGFTDTLGPQLIDATIVQFKQHALLADRVVAVVDVTLPFALDNLELHLVV